MRWNHLFKEAVGLGFLGLLLPCAGVAAAEDDTKNEVHGTLQIQSSATEGKSGTSAGAGQLIVSDGQPADKEKQGNQETMRFAAVDDGPGESHGKYWIGVGCQPASPALRAQLDLPKGQGLVVEQIVADGPAAKAGVKALDILLMAGDTALSEPSDLIKAVDTVQDKDLTLQLLRNGKPQTITVNAVTRPKQDRDVLRFGPDQEAWQKWLEQMPKMSGSGGGSGGFGGVREPMQFRVFTAPGMVVPYGGGGGGGTLTLRGRSELPENTSVTITRKGKEPAKISIKQGDESWDVTEDEIDKLPEKIRTLIQPMVGMPGKMMFQARAFPMPGMGGGGGGGFSGSVEQRATSPGTKSHTATDANDSEDRLAGKLEELGHRMDDLRDAIRDLRESRSHRETPPPPRPGGQE